MNRQMFSCSCPEMSCVPSEIIACWRTGTRLLVSAVPPTAVGRISFWICGLTYSFWALCSHLGKRTSSCTSSFRSWYKLLFSSSCPLKACPHLAKHYIFIRQRLRSDCWFASALDSSDFFVQLDSMTVPKFSHCFSACLTYLMYLHDVKH